MVVFLGMVKRDTIQSAIIRVLSRTEGATRLDFMQEPLVRAAMERAYLRAKIMGFANPMVNPIERELYPLFYEKKVERLPMVRIGRYYYRPWRLVKDTK